MTDIVYLNGEFLPSDQAKVSVLDRGFIFGDGVYEVIPVYGGHLFRLKEHIHRFDNSLTSIRIPQPVSYDTWRDVLTELVAKNGGGEQSIYVQITRGVAPRDHAFPRDTKPTLFAFSSPLTPIPEDILARGVCTVTMDDFRWQHCNIKAISLLPNILARQQALDMDASEAIFIRDGYITEGTTSNVFVINKGRVVTPPKSQHLLPGITRDLILELAEENHISNKETQLTLADLEHADEIWLSSSTKEILPVTQLNNKPVGNGKPGPLWAHMLALFQDYKQKIRINNTFSDN